MGTLHRLIVNRFSSLRARVLWTALAIVVIFVTAAAFVLQQAFQHGLIARLQSQLEVQTWALLGVADETDPGKLFLPEALPDQRLNQISSGRYARVVDDQGKEIWRSLSASGLSWKKQPSVLSGDSIFFATIIDHKAVFERDFGVTWESSGDNARDYHYTFQVAESKKSITAALDDFNYQLYSWLGFLGLALLLVQLLFLKFGLGPLKRISNELKAIEVGQIAQLSENYPDELKGLASRINLLLNFEKKQRIRYRDSLADLAHSLKTPLSVLRSGLEKFSQQKNFSKLTTDQQSMLDAQLGRINKTLSYYLNRAMVIGGGSHVTPVAIFAVVEELQKALNKVYFDKGIVAEIKTSGNPLFYGNEGDLMELAGNLLDNAYKYGAHRVLIQLIESAPDLLMIIENDGCAIAVEDRAQVLKRGARLDEKGQISGHGIGLSVVMDIIKAYEGKLEIDDSSLGGAKFIVHFKTPSL